MLLVPPGHGHRPEAVVSRAGAHAPWAEALAHAFDVSVTDYAPTNGASANGASANGASASGASANGASANGASANGASANGAPTNGASKSGVPRSALWLVDGLAAADALLAHTPAGVLVVPPPAPCGDGAEALARTLTPPLPG